MEIKWATLESADGERLLKQHAYVEAKRGAWHSDKYDGNKQLCNRKGGVHDGDKFVKLTEINPEAKSEKACKRCLKISCKK